MRRKIDIKLETVADMFSQLFLGRILVSTLSHAKPYTLEIRDGKFFIGGKESSTSNYLFMSDSIAKSYDVYEEIPWYENIPECGILCWVEGYSGEYPEIIVEYRDGYYIGIRGDNWVGATPFTQNDIKGRIL